MRTSYCSYIVTVFIGVVGLEIQIKRVLTALFNMLVFVKFGTLVLDCKNSTHIPILIKDKQLQKNHVEEQFLMADVVLPWTRFMGSHG